MEVVKIGRYRALVEGSKARVLYSSQFLKKNSRRICLSTKYDQASIPCHVPKLGYSVIAEHLQHKASIFATINAFTK